MYNRKIIQLLKAANENLHQYQIIMEESPMKSKKAVVKDLKAGLKEELANDRR